MTPMDINSWHETESYLLILIFTCTDIFLLWKHAYDETPNRSCQIHEQIRSLGLWNLR